MPASHSHIAQSIYLNQWCQDENYTIYPSSKANLQFWNHPPKCAKLLYHLGCAIGFIKTHRDFLSPQTLTFTLQQKTLLFVKESGWFCCFSFTCSLLVKLPCCLTILLTGIWFSLVIQTTLKLLMNSRAIRYSLKLVPLLLPDRFSYYQSFLSSQTWSFSPTLMFHYCQEFSHKIISLQHLNQLYAIKWQILFVLFGIQPDFSVFIWVLYRMILILWLKLIISIQPMSK